MPERLECDVLQKARYINTLTFYLYERPMPKQFCRLSLVCNERAPYSHG